MVIKLKQYEFKKTEVDSKNFILPINTVYFFQTHYRRSIRIAPIWTQYLKEQGKDERLTHFELTLLYQNFEFKIEKHNINVNSIEEVYYDNNHKLHAIIYDWVHGDLHERTKDQFNGELDYMIKELK